MKKFALVLLVSTLAFSSYANIALNIDAEALKDRNGIRIPDGTGLILLIADTSVNGFQINLTLGSSLTVGSSLGADDQILGKWAVGAGGFGAGTFEVGNATFDLAGSFNAGDPLGLYWFPNLTTSSANLTAGTFGVFTGGSGWVTPSDGSTVSLSFFTADATELDFGGPYLASRGVASLPLPVPEPSTMLLVGVGLLGAICLRRHRS
jgi:hypothetical protein